MNLTFISDTHTRHREMQLPGGDVLVHCGDFMNAGHVAHDISDFASWMVSQDYKHFILVAGNHDRLFQEYPEVALELLDLYGDQKINYLQDSSVTIEGTKFYGSPWTPYFCNWAFQLYGDDAAAEKWEEIPMDTDVLITHGPAFGYLDSITQVSAKPQGNLGCQPLRERIEVVKPKIHACGHIHSGQGVLDGYGEVTTHINAACLGEDYGYSNPKDFIEWTV